MEVPLDFATMPVNSLEPAVTQPSPGTSRLPRKRVLWKWSAAITVVFIGFLGWQCGSALLHGRELSNAAVQQFHRQLNGGDYEQIYGTAGNAFREADSKEKITSFLKAVHAKLGNANSEVLSNISVNATPAGVYVRTVYKTTFADGKAVETFVWLKNGNRLLLQGYNVQSNSFITR